MEPMRKQLSGIQGLGAAVFAVVVLGACSGVVTTDGATSSGSGGGGAGGAGPTSSSATSTTGTGTSTSTTVTTTTVSSTSTGGGAVVIGQACASDGDCGAEGHCILPTEQDPVLEGGAAGGYCTRTCDGDADCGFPAAECLLPANGAGECFKTCELGAPDLQALDDPLDPDKCHGREDLRCEERPNGSTLCLPTCGADAQCPGGFCDPKTALCSPVPPSGKGLGDTCNPDSMVSECAGLCIAIGSGKSMCTSQCVMAGAVDDPYECGGPASGVCLYAPSGTGVGDLAFCAESCTQQDQCQAPGFFCFDIDLPDNGVCIDSESCASDADCSFLDTTCVTTSLGQFCMSAQYPLGALAP